MRTLVWFRGKDLRVSDHAPLSRAAAAGEVVPLFVLDPYFFAPERARELPHRMLFLLESLASLAQNLEHAGSRLLLVEGRSDEVVPRLARELAVDRVVAQAWTEPLGRARDRRVRARLTVPLELMDGELLAPHGAVRTGQGGPFSVFTPFARAFRRDVTVGPCLPAPRKLPPLPEAARTVVTRALPTPAELGLTENPRLLRGGERAARARLDAFVATRLGAYATARDRLGVEGTSRLSQDLKFGVLSPRTVWNAVVAAAAASPARLSEGTDKLTNELLWREFTHHVADARPEVLTEPFKPAFRRFPWRDDEAAWAAWRAGRTGYPVVDAAARELLATGFVHNRARMITASFLTKHLLISYTRGEAHYLRYLTDGDWIQNNAGWQWSAGCGCDAQPYFRVFNPITQGQKFDPDGAYVGRWLPELGRLDAKYIHAPWLAPALTLRAAGITLGETYPLPVVDHATARARFLATAKAALGTPREA
ncbi:MAG TPA: deoxyribodipyrimidine photo-lyase [Polyangiaceae bacterium]|nr:deoxyribodipyrimidine photo-lyase [Polyangiaceae bacterium]